MTQTFQNSFFGPTFKQDGSYSKAEWQARETYYLNLIKTLYIPTACTTKDVSNISATISNALAEARWDLMNAKRAQDQWSTILDAEEKMLVNQIKSSSTQKLTVDEVKSLVTTELNTPSSPVSMKYLKGNGTVPGSLTLYENRFKFMSAIVNTLTDKNQTLILQASMLKLESGNSAPGSYGSDIPAITE